MRKIQLSFIMLTTCSSMLYAGGDLLGTSNVKYTDEVVDVLIQPLEKRVVITEVVTQKNDIPKIKDTKVEKKKSEKSVELVTKATTQSKYFAYVAGGVSFLDTQSNLPAISQKKGALDERGKIIDFGIGTKLTHNIFATLSEQRTEIALGDINSIYTSLNYQFTDVMLKPFFGALVGYSKLNWDSRPYKVARAIEKSASSGTTYGIQTGVEQKITKNWSGFAKYQFVKYDHQLNIDNGKYDITHDSVQNALVGVRYGF